MQRPPTDLLQAAESVIVNAYAPYSNYPVAAALRSEDNHIFVGCNVENASFPVGVCAEGGALSALVVAGQHKIKEGLILVTSNNLCPPCGACRQRLVEFADPSVIIHLCTADGKHQSITVESLMPLAFSPKHLE